MRKSLAVLLAVIALAACADLRIEQTSLRAGTADLTDNLRPAWEHDPRRGYAP